MNINYVTFSVFPAQSAHSIHIMKICQALADNGHKVTLIAPDRKDASDSSVDEIFKFYNIKGDFSFIKLAVPMIKGWKLLYPFYVSKFVSKNNKGIVFTRHAEIAAVTTLLKIPTILEFHHTGYTGNAIQKLLYKKLFKSSSLLKIVVISEALKNAFVKKGFNKNNLLVAHDGSDLASNKSKIALDKGSYQLEAGYVGQLYEGKGIEIIVDVAAHVPHVRFHIVGGQTDDIAKWKGKADSNNLSNIVFHGFVPQTFISEYINAFDVCLLPNQRKVSFFGNSTVNISDYTSPLKMFDYMAHGKTIIASDLPVLREVLNENNAILCDPEDLDSWANALNKLANDVPLREKLSENALADFTSKYTWKKRAEYIIDNSVKRSINER
jgi:glycosyltransferase involved in cell wall biosynthesis